MVVCMATPTSRHNRNRNRVSGVSYSKSRYYRKQQNQRRNSQEKTGSDSTYPEMGHEDDQEKTIKASPDTEITSLEERIKAIVLERHCSGLSNQKSENIRRSKHGRTEGRETDRRKQSNSLMLNGNGKERSYLDVPIASNSEVDSVIQRSEHATEAMPSANREKLHSNSRQKSQPDLKDTKANRHSIGYDPRVTKRLYEFSGTQLSDLSNRERIRRSHTVDDVILSSASNSANITDSEKIYHKLRGITKISRHKSLYVPRCGRTSLISDSLSENVESGANLVTKHVPKRDKNKRDEESKEKISKNPKAGMSKELSDTKRSADGSPEDGKCLEVRRCRIGASLAFGLVQIAKKPPVSFLWAL